MTSVWGTARPWNLAASARLYVRSALDIVCFGDAELAATAQNEPLADQLRVEFIGSMRVRENGPGMEFAVQRFEHFAATLRRLQAAGRNYTHVMVMDASDALFQGDPFENVEPNTVIFSQEAGIKLKEEMYNSFWITHMRADGADDNALPSGPTRDRPYNGCAMLEEIGDEIVSCSGATLGTADAMGAYLDDMSAIITSLPARLSTGIDQVRCSNEQRWSTAGEFH